MPFLLPRSGAFSGRGVAFIRLAGLFQVRLPDVRMLCVSPDRLPFVCGRSSCLPSAYAVSLSSDVPAVSAFPASGTVPASAFAFSCSDADGLLPRTTVAFSRRVTDGVAAISLFAASFSSCRSIASISSPFFKVEMPRIPLPFASSFKVASESVSYFSLINTSF